MDVQHAREQMIDQQVRTWEVLDNRVLKALAGTPRERFVPEEFRQLAFADTPIRLPLGQQMMTPSVEGRMLQAVSVSPGDNALDIGTGSGFSAACLAALGARVTSIDLHTELVERASAIHAELGIGAITCNVADAAELEEPDKYDVIAVTGSIPVLDERFSRALRPGGRLFLVVGTEPVMEAVLITRTGTDTWLSESLFETVLPPLEHFSRPSGFEF